MADINDGTVIDADPDSATVSQGVLQRPAFDYPAPATARLEQRMSDFTDRAEAWRADPTGDPHVIDPLIAAAHAEIAALKKALAESPLAAEMWKQMPNAMRLHTAATDRASELINAVRRWAEHDRGNPLPALRHDAELLEAYEAFTSPEPDGGMTKTPPQLAAACPRCHAPVGQLCRTFDALFGWRKTRRCCRGRALAVRASAPLRPVGKEE